jgi:hypothetical protein
MKPEIPSAKKMNLGSHFSMFRMKHTPRFPLPCAFRVRIHPWRCPHSVFMSMPSVYVHVCVHVVVYVHLRDCVHVLSLLDLSVLKNISHHCQFSCFLVSFTQLRKACFKILSELKRTTGTPLKKLNTNYPKAIFTN